MNVDQLIADLRVDEGIKLCPYPDTEGKLTIGIGRCLDTAPLTAQEMQVVGHDCRTRPITASQAEFLCHNSVIKVIHALDARIPWWTQLSDVRQRVLANMVYQMGIDGVLKFRKFLAALQAGNYTLAADEMLDSKWARQTPERAVKQSEAIRTGSYT